MIIVMKPNAPIEERNKIIAGLESKGYKIDVSQGSRNTILGIVGDTSVLIRTILWSMTGLKKSCVCRSLLNGQTVHFIRKTV